MNVSQRIGAYRLNPIPDRIIRQAQEGKFIDIHMFLQPSASSTYTSTTNNENAIESLVSLIRNDPNDNTNNKQTRRVTNISQLHEALYNGMIGTVYRHNTSAVGELMGFYALVEEIGRKHGFAAAFEYCETIRRRQCEEKHYRLDQFDPLILVDITNDMMQARAKQLLSPNHSKPNASGKIFTCINWNDNRTCIYTPCKFKHWCSRCYEKTHRLINCPQPATKQEPTPATETQYKSNAKSKKPNTLVKQNTDSSTSS
jgi:hypothetical protein